MSVPANDNPVLGRMRALRGSLRRPVRRDVEETPVEESERRLWEQGWSARERLTGWALVWLGSQAIGVLLFAVAAGWPAPRPSWLFIPPAVCGIAMLAIATWMAVIAMRHSDSLPRRWIVGAFLPWGLHVLEATVLLVVVV